MTRDPRTRAMDALRRVRHIETDEARRDLADALAVEDALRVRDEGLVRAMAAARGVTGDFDREALAAFLTHSGRELAALADALRAAEARTAEVRAALTRRRRAEDAANDARDRIGAALAVEEARRDQVVLEEAARGVRRVRE